MSECRYIQEWRERSDCIFSLKIHFNWIDWAGEMALFFPDLFFIHFRKKNYRCQRRLSECISGMREIGLFELVKRVERVTNRDCLIENWEKIRARTSHRVNLRSVTAIAPDNGFLPQTSSGVAKSTKRKSNAQELRLREENAKHKSG